MSETDITQDQDQALESAGVPETGDATTTAEPPVDAADDISVKSAAFQELESDANSGPKAESKRINEIRVQVSAELGRREMTIHDLLELHAGSVVELDRSIESHVELVAQGVALAKGEVVVVNDRFALKITEVYQNQKLDAG